jgi:hypothetical protein
LIHVVVVVVAAVIACGVELVICAAGLGYGI